MTTQLTAGLTQQAEAWGREGRHITEKAKAILATLILPQTITPYQIERYYRKAHRTGAWRELPKEARALLQAARKTIKNKVKSPTLHTTLTKTFLKIELFTRLGKALLIGLIQTLTQAKPTLNLNKNKLLYLGINWLNTPPTHKTPIPTTP